MSEFANEKNNNDNVDIKKKNMDRSLENTNKLETKLSLEKEYDFKGKKTKRKIRDIIAKDSIKEWHPKISYQPLNFILVPNNINPIIHQKNKFDFNDVGVPNSSKIIQYETTNCTNNNINYTKLDIKSEPFYLENVKLKKNFNEYVANRIANHKKESIISIHDTSDRCCTVDGVYVFQFTDLEDISLTNVLEGLWSGYCCNYKIEIRYDKTVKKQICVLNKTNENNLLKLINEIQIIEIRKSFNKYVNEAIKNHETEPLFKVNGNRFVVGDKNYAFGNNVVKKLVGTQVLKRLWDSFVQKNNIKVDNKDTFKLDLLRKNCILSDENKNKLYKLLDDAKEKAFNEQAKNLEKEIIEKKKRNDIKQKLSKQVDVLINDIYKFENNYIVCGEDGERYHDKNHLSGEYTNVRALRATSMLIKEKLINSFLNPEDKSVMTDDELNQIVSEVVESKKNKIEEKIASDIEKRKQVLKDFNGFVSCMIDKHNDTELIYGYDYEKQKFYLLPDKFYDTVDDLETALIKIYAKRYPEHKSTEKPYNPFDSNSYSVNVDSIEVLDDITKRKLDDSISMIFKDRLDELSKIFNNSCKSDVKKFISDLLGDDWRLKIRDRNKDIIIKEIKKVILDNLIDRLKEPEKTKYHEIPYDVLRSASISPIYLDNIFVDVLPYKVDSSVFGFWYYKPNKINSNNFDAKFDELKNEYGEKNISPIAACYFLSAIKKDDLTPERVNKVWNEVNADLWHSFSVGTDDRLMTLVNNLLDGNFPSDEYLDIFIFCIRLDINFKYMDDNSLDDYLYNMIYGIITNSKEYKQANGNKEREAVAIKKFFDPNKFSKKFWITLAEFDANNHPSHKLFYSKNLTMRKMKELAYNQKNKYSQKLNNLLQDHDIYISPTTEKIKDDKEKEVDQICIKVDSYQAVQTQAKKDFDEYMKKVIYDLKNDQNVKYDWAKGTLTYNEKIIYNFKKVEFYDEAGKKCDAADETWQFVAFVTEFYCQDHKLPSYGLDLALYPNDVREIQNIVGKKQQAKIKELIDGFSKFVDEKIEKHKKQEGPLFRLEGNSICDYKFDKQDMYDFVMVNYLAEEIVEEFTKEYFEGKFYIYTDIKKIEMEKIKEQENKLKTLFNDEIKKHVEKNKLNYEYNKEKDFWDEIPKKNMEIRVKVNNNLLKIDNKNLEISITEKSKIENKIGNDQNNKIEEKLIEEENINEDEYVEVLVNEVLKKATESLAKEKNEIKNETKTMKNNIIIQNNNQIENKVNEEQNNKQDNNINVDNITTKRMGIAMNEEQEADNNNSPSHKNDDESVSSEVENKEEINSDYDQKNQEEDINSNKIENENKAKLQKSDIFQNEVNLRSEQIKINETNTDENKDQKEIETKKRKESGEITTEAKHGISTGRINSKINENTIQEASNNLKNQTLNSLDQNNPNESETKNKGWIKFLTFLKWITLIGFILALATTVTSIFVAALSDLIVKFAIAAVVLFCVFVVSKLLVSCLSNKKPKENENPYQKQFDTDFGKIKDQNELDINTSKHESNINQIAEQEKNNVSSIEGSLG